jgi:SAM-dependent methyltransferase
MSHRINKINMGAMRSTAAVAQYSRHDQLTLAERASLNKVKTLARGKSLLDIGVGGGRTVTALREVSNNYLGIDNSPEMLAACRQRYPGVRFAHADARQLSDIADGSIFLVMFSCNGIGMVSHDDRLKILAEIYRVLQPDGVFLFSTHNQNCPDHTAGFQFPEFEFSPNPARLAVRSARFLRSTLLRARNRRRFARHDVRTPEFSMINDVCHDYGVMLYYISLHNQRRQIEALGFKANAVAYDCNGNVIVNDSIESSIAFIARK